MKCQWGPTFKDCRGPPVMLAKGLSDKWLPICARCRSKRVMMGNSLMEYKPLPDSADAPHSDGT